ncbi:MAG: hypothetical protein AAGK32_12435, partial [Actinomycetota bacterium]
MSSSDDIYILGIDMTAFGKRPDDDIVDLASEAVTNALDDAGVTMADMGVLAAGNLMQAHSPSRSTQRVSASCVAIRPTTSVAPASSS